MTWQEVEDECIALSDSELVRRLYAIVSLVDDDEVAQQFNNLLQEAFERWAPAAEWAEVERQRRELSSPERLAGELRDARDATRRREAARLLHRAVARGRGGDG